MAKSETNIAPVEAQTISIFTDIKAFENAQRMVKPLADSALVPDTFRGKIGDCMIALEMANRTGASPLSIMQNMYIVHGKPAWSSQFLIAAINACGKFSPLRYTQTGEKGKDSFGMLAWAYDRTGEKLEGPEVTIEMAKKEGWYTKNGSKWPTMPELMLRYRAATFFARLYCPEISMGMQTADEVSDIADEPKRQEDGRFARRSPIDITCAVETSDSAPYDAEAEALFKEVPISIEDALEWYRSQKYAENQFCDWVKKTDIQQLCTAVLNWKEAQNG